MSLNITKLYKISSLTSRTFHTSSIFDANVGRTMKKVMGVTSKKKRTYSETPVLPTPSTLSKGSYEGRYSGNSRRNAVLNKLFMRHITDLMATGENSTEFLGHGIEINRVQISPDFKGLNVFWAAKSLENDETIEKILQKNAGYLRHELSTLRVMGVVPMIRFVKDKLYSKVIEVDARLAEADFGEEHDPVEPETKLKTQLELITPLSEDVKEKLMKLEKEIGENEIEEDEPLPPMPQDVLGLNHADILNRVLKAMKKSEATHRLSSDNGCDDIELNHTINEKPVEYSREAFKNFLQKRELMRSKAKKLEKNYIPDVECIKQELMERQAEYFKNMDVYDYQDEEDDYLNDEDELK